MRLMSDILVLAFQTLPMVIVLSVLSGLLIYFGILPWILRLMSLLLEKTLRILRRFFATVLHPRTFNSGIQIATHVLVRRFLLRRPHGG